ncbi:RES family NAD+ phosphorylase [Pseudomonas sp. Root562]|uniref:RES family NAD+ phosphorylase n=1 Tax=Pseudomonas sp. Root562 TaxID=1736561 RepID=UPI0007032013|nr:RES family NAD+ phosphorylase [Pseudomonas sp. Root562]KQZ81129.1 hypothetical protein ASD60_12540 [Pseudomonas sp. Root562]
MEQIPFDTDDGNTMFICLECIGDPMLKGFKSLPEFEVTCTACNCLTRQAVTPARIARFIRKHLPTHFSVDDGLYDGCEMSLAEVVSRAIRCDNLLACKAIAHKMVSPRAHEDDFYWQGQVYCVKRNPFDDAEHERWWIVGDWHDIAYELSHERRFFSDKARKFFESLLHEALSAEKPCSPGTPAVITTLLSGTELYRARIAANPTEVQHFKSNPLAELGAPPMDRAKNNRMSAAGFSWMYVSQDTTTCVREVLPNQGDMVVVGEFVSTTPLRVFDLNALSLRLKHAPLSLFSPDYEQRSNHRQLLRYLHDEIAQPIERPETDYVMTQAFAEYIRCYAPHQFDGISFRSVQHPGGINYALFAKDNAERVRSAYSRPAFDLVISSDSVTLQIAE